MQPRDSITGRLQPPRTTGNHPGANMAPGKGSAFAQWHLRMLLLPLQMAQKETSETRARAGAWAGSHPGPAAATLDQSLCPCRLHVARPLLVSLALQMDEGPSIPQTAAARRPETLRFLLAAGARQGCCAAQDGASLNILCILHALFRPVLEVVWRAVSGPWERVPCPFPSLQADWAYCS